MAGLIEDAGTVVVVIARVVVFDVVVIVVVVGRVGVGVIDVEVVVAARADVDFSPFCDHQASLELEYFEL